MNREQTNAKALEQELAWFAQVLEARITDYFQQQEGGADVHALRPPMLDQDASEYASLVREHDMGFEERLVLILALIPHIRPQALDTFFMRNTTLDRGFTEFGGWKGMSHGGFLPTAETAAFLIAGEDIHKRLLVVRLFEADHFFAREGILRLEHQNGNEPLFSGALVIGNDCLQRVTTGIRHKPDFAIHFPAKLITTPLTWEDLVLAPEVLEEIGLIRTWIKDAPLLMEDWGLKKSIKPGYRTLFHGPPGTGKTLTATLIGASAGVDVYRIDLSMVVSKFIGETEKNLAGIFDQAKHKNWILFFDEADALFGKRTQTNTANDRHANQEISYLLQRVEDFPGVVILATNLKTNMDEAFARRFQSAIYFPMPDADLRLRLWRGITRCNCELDQDVRLEELADRFELAGGAIVNVVRYAAIKALQSRTPRLRRADLLRGITRELKKEGKTPSFPS